MKSTSKKQDANLPEETKKKHFKHYLAGFLFLLLFLFIFDRGLHYLLFRMENHFGSLNTEYENLFKGYVKENSFDTLLLGTSRTYEGIHPEYLEDKLGAKIFKEAYQGKGPLYNYHFYKLFKKYAGIPKVVIYGVDYFIYTITSNPEWLSRFNLESREERKKLFSTPIMLLKFKHDIDIFHNNMMNRLKKFIKPENESPYKEFNDLRQYNGRIIKDKNRMVTEAYPNFQRVNFHKYPGKEGKHFAKLMEELHKDGVTVILVGLPDYIGSYKTNYQRTDFQTHLKSFPRKYPNTHLYNYNKPRYFPLHNQDYFNDGGYGMANSHLSHEGSVIFCKLLVEDIKKHFKKDAH